MFLQGIFTLVSKIIFCFRSEGVEGSKVETKESGGAGDVKEGAVGTTEEKMET